MIYRQSVLEDARCLHRFRAHHIDGVPRTDNEFAVRGRDLHAMHAEYVEHLATTKQDADFEAAERISNRPSLPTDAAALFRRWYPGKTFEPGTIFGAEVAVKLAEDLRPIYAGIDSNAAPFRYAGTLDRLELRGKVADITDLKSHWAVFEPDTIQAVFYAWLVAHAFPGLEQVNFHLDFVRYGITKTREFLVSTIDEVFAKEVQPWIVMIETAVTADEWPALPNSKCSVCTLTCPLVESGIARKAIGQIGTLGEAREMASELYALQAAATRLTGHLRAYVASNGPIAVGDGRELSFRKRTSSSYKPRAMAAVNAKYGFEATRGLKSDSTAIKQVLRNYPEYAVDLAPHKVDRSAAIFGFGEEEPSEPA